MTCTTLTKAGKLKQASYCITAYLASSDGFNMLSGPWLPIKHRTATVSQIYTLYRRFMQLNPLPPNAIELFFYISEAAHFPLFFECFLGVSLRVIISYVIQTDHLWYGNKAGFSADIISPPLDLKMSILPLM